MEDFRNTLEQLNEKMDEALIKKWKEEDWDRWIQDGINRHPDVDTSKLHSQFKRYDLRNMEPELAVAEYDFHRPRHNTQQIMDFYIKYSWLHWNKIKDMERANA